MIHLTIQESKSHGNLLLVHLLEKEKKSLELVISSQQAQEHALKTHIQHLQDELENQDSMVCICMYYICIKLFSKHLNF